MKGISGDLFAYTSTRHAFSMIVQVEGIKGLYKGMWPNLLKVTQIACMCDKVIAGFAGKQAKEHKSKQQPQTHAVRCRWTLFKALPQ